MPKDYEPVYDIAWLRSGGAKQGFMLAEEDGRKMYQESRSRVLSPQYTTGQVGYASLPPEQDMAIAVQSEWHGGFGQLDYLGEVGEGRQYSESIGWDTRTKGQLRLSPTEQAATVSLRSALTTTSYANMGFETWGAATSLTSWTKSASSLITTQEAGTVQAGTYSCNLTFVDAPAITDGGFETWTDAYTLTNWTKDAGTIEWAPGAPHSGSYACTLDVNTAAEIHQDQTWDARLQSVEVIWTAYLKSNGAVVRIGVNDGVTTTWSGYDGGTGNWTQATVTKTLAAAATRLRLIVQRANNASTASVDTAVSVTVTVVSTNIYQDLSGWASYYNNKAATFTCYARTGLASNIRIGIDDGVDVSYSSYLTGDNTWREISVTKTPAINATRLRILIYRDSATDATTDYVDAATFSQPAASRGTPVVNGLFLWGSTYYYLENKTIFSLSGTTFTEIFTFANAITGYGIHGSNLYMCFGTSVNYAYSSNGTTWTATTNASARMNFMAVVRNTCYGSSSGYEIKSTTTPETDTSWSSATVVGNSANSITALSEYNQALYMAKTEQLYNLDSSGVAQPLTPDMKTRVDADNFENMGSFHGVLMLPNVDGLARYLYTSYGDTDDISPKRYGSSNTDFHGQMTACIADMQWIYTASDHAANTTLSKIMALRYEAMTGVEVQSDWRWQCFQEVSLNPVIAMGINSTKLWVAGTLAGSAAVKYYSLANDDFPAATTGTKVEFEIDDAGSWTEVGGVGNGSYTTTAGVKAFQTSQSGKRIRFRLTAASKTFITPYYDGGFRGIDKNFLTFELYGTSLNAAGGTATPIIRAIICRGVLASPSLRQVDCTIRIENGLVLKDGRADDVLGDTVKTFLVNAADDTNPGTFYDIRGTSYKAKLIPPSPLEVLSSDYPPDKVQSMVRLLIQEVKDS